MFVCVACGYLWKEADSPPEECPACTAPKEKYIPYDDRAERWVKRAVAAHVMYHPDEEGADLPRRELRPPHHTSDLRSSGYLGILRKNRMHREPRFCRRGFF